MVGHILDAKVRVPKSMKNMIPRYELCNKINNSREKIVMVKAGSGYGKTVGLSFFANENIDKCTWYNIEDTDDDFYIFIGYFEKSIKRLVEGFEFDYEKYYYSKNEEKVVEIMAYDFVAKLNTIDKDIFIILDDFQYINDVDIFKFLNILFDFSEDNIRFLIATNGIFPEYLSKIYLSGKIYIIGHDDLVFGCSEIEGKLIKCGNVENTFECAERIFDYSEGLAICVMSVILQISQERGIVNLDNIDSYCQDDKAVEYVIMNLYRKLPYDLQLFLKNTCIFDEITVGLCNYVLGVDDSKSNLEYFVSKNLFVVKIPGKADVYRYHSIFKKYLVANNTRDEKHILLEKGARYYLAHEDYIRSIEYAYECDKFEIAQEAFSSLEEWNFSYSAVKNINEIMGFMNRHKSEWNDTTKLIVSNYYYAVNETEKAYEIVKEVLLNEIDDKNAKKALELLKMILIGEGKFVEFENIVRPYYENKNSKKLYLWYLFANSVAEIELCKGQIDNSKKIFKEIVNTTTGILSAKRLEEIIQIKKDAEIMISGEFEKNNISNVFINSYALWNAFEEKYKDYEKITVELLGELTAICNSGKYNNTYIIYSKYVLSYLEWLENGSTINDKMYYVAENYLNKANVERPFLRGKNAGKFIGNLNNKEKQVKRTEKLSVNCFGKFEISYDNEKVIWRTKKAKELVAFLVDRCGVGVTKETIMDEMWPDGELDATNLFYTSLSYARGALKKIGFYDIIRQKNKAYYIDMDRVELDYQEYSTFGEKNIDAETVDLEYLLHMGEKYMADIDSLWIIGHREYYSRAYENVCIRYAEILEEKGNSIKSIELLNMAFNKNDFSENIAIKLIEKYAMKKEFIKAKNVFLRVQKKIKNEFDMDLSDDFMEKYNIIMKNNKRI